VWTEGLFCEHGLGRPPYEAVFSHRRQHVMVSRSRFRLSSAAGRLAARLFLVGAWLFLHEVPRLGSRSWQNLRPQSLWRGTSRPFQARESKLVTPANASTRPYQQGPKAAGRDDPEIFDTPLPTAHYALNLRAIGRLVRRCSSAAAIGA